MWRVLFSVVCRGCDVCGVARSKTPPCVDSKRLCLYIQNVPVRASNRSTCLNRYGRGPSTHGDVLRRFESTFGGTPPVQLTKKSPTWSYHLAPEVHQRNERILPIYSVRMGREQHVPNSSNHSLFLMNLLHSSSPEGNCEWEPAVRWFGWSSALYPSITNDVHVSIATSLHQSSLLTLPFRSIVLCLSSPDTYSNLFQDHIGMEVRGVCVVSVLCMLFVCVCLCLPVCDVRLYVCRGGVLFPVIKNTTTVGMKV